jgi:hypothetical protein
MGRSQVDLMAQFNSSSEGDLIDPSEYLSSVSRAKLVTLKVETGV